jgi:hypothetical protein
MRFSTFATRSFGLILIIFEEPMFKLFFHGKPRQRAFAPWFGGLGAALLLPALGAAGCRTASPLPPADFKQPGWTVRQGQAVYVTKRGAPEIAGEILLATRNDDRAFVQFSKTPFPLMIAQSASNYWELQVPAQNRRYAGHGLPPARLILLWLARVLSGQPPPKGWSWHSDEHGWRLENPATGERLEGYLNSE